ncbi:molybdenum cofactor guanylyltransferase, partial [Aspergillus homomorphus CBS 101889]
MESVKGLILAGGTSSRMKTRKELLSFQGDVPMYRQLIAVLHDALPESDTIYLSMRSKAASQALPDITTYGTDSFGLEIHHKKLCVQIIYDDNASGDDGSDIGPAAGLLAAYRHDPKAKWLVIACDYPFLTTNALRQLLRHSEEAPVVCFENQEGWYEPLLALWTPQALRLLASNVQKGILGPKSAIKAVQGCGIRPLDERWLFNTNNRTEWQRALALKDG